MIRPPLQGPDPPTTGSDWRYARVNQVVFDSGLFATFDALVAAAEAARVKAAASGLETVGQ